MKIKPNPIAKALNKGSSHFRILKTVKMVDKQGLGTEIDFGYNIKQFKCKNGCEHHNHLVCVVCHRHVYLDFEPLEDLQDKLARAKGFIPKKHNLKVYGVCANCR